MSNYKEDFKTIIDLLVNSFDKEVKDRNEENIDKLTTMYQESKNGYMNSVERAYNEFKKITTIPFELADTKNKYILEYILNGLFEHYFEKYMEKNEGRGASCDKARFVKLKTLKALETGENQSLYADYNGEKNIPQEKWNERAYWSPSTISDTDQAMKMFYNWYFLRE